jgi:hypothetical protein
MVNKGEVIIYKTPDGETSIDVRLENETVWLTTEQMATLFQRDGTVIGSHISNIFKEGELDPKVVRSFFAHTTPHGAIVQRRQQKNCR